MEGVLDVLKNNSQMLVEIFEGALAEEWNKWEDAPANVDQKQVVELGQKVGAAFLIQGPGAIGPILLEMGLI